MMLWIGLGLMFLGVLVYALGRSGRGAQSLHASGGSVVVGGNNSGKIQNKNVGKPSEPQHSGHWLTIIAILVELAGIGVTFWHAFHLAAK